MTFLTEILGGGSNFEVKLNQDGASFGPIGSSDDELAAFQIIVGKMEEHDGDGYTVAYRHFSSDHGLRLCDLLIIVIDDE